MWTLIKLSFLVWTNLEKLTLISRRSMKPIKYAFYEKSTLLNLTTKNTRTSCEDLKMLSCWSLWESFTGLKTLQWFVNLRQRWSSICRSLALINDLKISVPASMLLEKLNIDLILVDIRLYGRLTLHYKAFTQDQNAKQTRQWWHQHSKQLLCLRRRC